MYCTYLQVTVLWCCLTMHFCTQKLSANGYALQALHCYWFRFYVRGQYTVCVCVCVCVCVGVGVGVCECVCVCVCVCGWV